MKNEQSLIIRELGINQDIEKQDFAKIAAQLQKDFELSGIGSQADFDGCESIFELLQNLSSEVSRLINGAPRDLMSLLYRIDIPENKVSQALVAYNGVDSSLVIAALILVKTRTKIELRKQFK